MRHAFCDNDRFDYLYLHKLDNGATRPRLSDEQSKDLDQFVSEWQVFLENKTSADNKERALKEEFSYVIKNLVRDFKKLPESPNKEHDFQLKQNEIIAYNKYIFQKGLDIFPTVLLPLKFEIGNKKLYLDEHLLFHALIRHHGEIVKQTTDLKSFFTEDVLVEDIYDLISRFLNLIIEKGIVVKNKICMCFEYKSNPYKLYTKIIDHSTYRVNSFFPLEDPEKINELSEEYKKIKLDEDIFYYEKESK